jgi:hypothetical protein
MRTFFAMMMLSLVGLVFTANAVDEKKLLDMTYAFASDTHWPTAKPFNTDEPGNVSDLHFPGSSKEATELLIKQRSVKAVGIDTPSIDSRSLARFFGPSGFRRSQPPDL